MTPLKCQNDTRAGEKNDYNNLKIKKLQGRNERLKYTRKKTRKNMTYYVTYVLYSLYGLFHYVKKTLFKLGRRTRMEGAKEETPFFDRREGFRVGNGKLPLPEAKARQTEDLTPQ